jgi:hypothetical protein
LSIKRAELARRTDFSERHLSRIRAEIPGVEFSSGGQTKFDETNPELQRWIAESKTRNQAKRLSRAMPRKKREAKLPTMAEDLAALARFVDAFKKLRESGAKVRFTRSGVDFLDPCSLKQWEAVLEFLKRTLELPTEGQMMLLQHYFGKSPPESLGEIEAASKHPMFAALTNMSPQSRCQNERALLPAEAKEAATFWLSDTIKKGHESFGAEKVDAAVVRLELRLHDMRQAVCIGELAKGVRMTGLTVEHLYVLGRADLPPDEQHRWAIAAQENELPPLRLKASIEAGKVLTAEELSALRGSNTGILTIQGLIQKFEIWRRTVEKDKPIENWNRKAKLALWEELEGPTMLGMELARELGISLETTRGV